MSDEQFDPADEQDDTMFWEDAAHHAVDQAIASSYFDEVNGVIEIPDSTEDPRMAHRCHSLEDYRDTLETLYDEQWYAYVPFEGGEALFDGDAAGYASEAIDEEKIQQFFDQFDKEPEGTLIFTAADLLTPGASKVVRLDVQAVNDELIAHLAAHPEKMRDLQPRKFEELVAELFKSKGYDVTLTPATRDGGVDIRAIRRNELGTILVLIECKRYAAHKKVGVEIVRGLYGVVGEQRATKGIIATTSYFSGDAKQFHNNLQYQLELADYDNLCAMLKEWKTNKP